MESGKRSGRTEGVERCWDEDGHLVETLLFVDGQAIAGIVCGNSRQYAVGLNQTGRFQNRWQDGNLVETRTSPPWFTEEEILQAVEGVEE